MNLSQLVPELVRDVLVLVFHFGYMELSGRVTSVVPVQGWILPVSSSSIVHAAQHGLAGGRGRLVRQVFY